jgi:hypothetical protein
MEAIEASIAYKKAPAKQPQKKTQQAPPEDKPDGVSRDETKPVEDKSCKTNADCPDGKVCDAGQCKPEKVAKVDKTDPLAKFRRNIDEDTPVSDKPTTDVGDFNDNERGFADETKGDPFFQRVARDVNESWEYPKILEAKHAAVGCIHILADGKVAKWKIDQKSGDDSLDDSAERALKKVEKIRNDKPEPVPTHLLKAATTRWICFKFNPQRVDE